MALLPRRHRSLLIKVIVNRITLLQHQMIEKSTPRC